MKLGRVVDPKHSMANIRMFEYIQIFSATISTWLCATLGFERIGKVVILTSRLNSNISTIESQYLIIFFTCLFGQIFTIYSIIHLFNLIVFAHGEYKWVHFHLDFSQLD